MLRVKELFVLKPETADLATVERRLWNFRAEKGKRKHSKDGRALRDAEMRGPWGDFVKILYATEIPPRMKMGLRIGKIKKLNLKQL